MERPRSKRDTISGACAADDGRESRHSSSPLFCVTPFLLVLTVYGLFVATLGRLLVPYF